MSVRAKAVPSDPALRKAWRDLWAAIKTARRTFESAGVEMHVDIRVTERTGKACER